MDQADIHSFNRLQEFARDSCPSAWLEYAEEPRDSAELIWTREEDLLGVSLTLDAGHHVLKDKRVSTVSRTYMLLAGFALENVLKGHFVAKNPSLVNQGFLNEELKSHDITGLAAKIRNLVLSKAERAFCDHATKAIPYS